jgi:two-component system, OmpR family, heavy metal sensor histidine kinase CusS
MKPGEGLLRRVFGRLRRSMTAQISLSITLVSVLIIAVFVLLTGRFVREELREENELTLLANLAFIRDDLAAARYDPAQAQRLVAAAEQRFHGLHAAILDGEGRRVLASSPRYLIPLPAALPRRVLDAALLPAGAHIADMERVRDRFADATATWLSPDGNGHRLLTGRIEVPAEAARPAGSLLIDLAIETSSTRGVRLRERRNLLVGLVIAALLASVLGVLIARRILVRVRRLGSTASRIGAQALDERLPLDDTPLELVESAVAFNRMLDRLQSAFQRLSAFSSDLAHDLRTPVGNLLGEAQVALSRPRSADEYRAVLESAVEEYERLSRMIGNMLFLAQADNASAALSFDWTPLDPALERVIGYFELLAEERGVVLEKTLRAAAGVERRVWADETMLIRAVSNLVSNALRYAPSGTRVELAADVAADGGATISVSNEGPAIAGEQQPRIFERFYRADASRHGSATGSGLGLAIVRSIMELHGGSASLRSAPDEDTVFSLHFPPPPIARRPR